MIWQLGSPRGEDAAQDAIFLAFGGLSISSAQGVTPRHRIWFPRALGSSLGWVFICDGDELGDSSVPPLTPVISGLIAQQLLRHGESLRRR
jgi:hypothetical protein